MVAYFISETFYMTQSDHPFHHICSHEPSVDQFLGHFYQENKHQTIYLQAVTEVLSHLLIWMFDTGYRYKKNHLSMLLYPDRMIKFKVPWFDDQNQLHINCGYRVQHSRLLGPYKGGLRFSPYVNESVLKFLAFEQTFKNALTGLPLGSGKGGADFDPKGKSEHEIKRFSKAFIEALAPFLGANFDVPAGDIGVGSAEIDWMYGQLMHHYHDQGVLTGKSLALGGSHVRKEATGYGCVYFLDQMLKKHLHVIKDKRIGISGAGNVALYAAEKCLQLEAVVITLSDSGGVLVAEKGLTSDMLETIKTMRSEKKRLPAIAEHLGLPYHPGKKPWYLPMDIALACATENELSADDARMLCDHGLLAICEGANMPCSIEATEIFQKHDVLFGPGKAANAGGVAVSGLEMSQNKSGLYMTFIEADTKLHHIMEHIHQQCCEYGQGGEIIDYIKGANIASFKRLADAIHGVGY